MGSLGGGKHSFMDGKVHPDQVAVGTSNSGLDCILAVKVVMGNRLAFATSVLQLTPSDLVLT